MKIIAKNEQEFEELVRTFRYLHDFTIWTKKFNWKFWQWVFFRSCFICRGECLNLEEYPLLNSLVHLYRIKHAHLEGPCGIIESNYLKDILYIEGEK